MKRKPCITGRPCVMLLQSGDREWKCADCGRTVPNGAPLDVGAAHLIADIAGHGLRSVRTKA